MKYAVGFSGKGFGGTVRGILVDLTDTIEDTAKNARRAKLTALDVARKLWSPDIQASVDYTITIYKDATSE